MKYKYLNKLIITISSLIIIGSIYFFNIDNKGKELINGGLEQAVVVFAIAKGLNGAISLAQGTHIEPPGLSFSVGEVLDPINDLVEQFSWIMLASITSLGIQKIMLNFIDGYVFNILLLASVVLLNIWIYIRFKNDEKIRSVFFKIVIILVFLRLSIPFMSIINNLVYYEYVKSDYNIEQRVGNLQTSAEQIENITMQRVENSTQVQKEESFFDKTKNAFNSIGDSVSNFFSKSYYKEKLDQYKQVAEDSSTYITDLIIAFIFKTIFFPLLFLFLLYRLLANLFRLGK